jgi:hypothetical protein
MEELTIVRKRTRVWPILLTLVVLALIAIAIFYAMGDRAAAGEFGLLPESSRWVSLTGGNDGTA